MYPAARHPAPELVGLTGQEAEGAPMDRHDQLKVEELVAGDRGRFRPR